jgi:hypothetical protein
MSTSKIISQEANLANPNQDYDTELTPAAKGGFTVQSRVDVKTIITRFFDLVENRKFSLIQLQLEAQERKAREAQASMVSNPKINARSEKIVAQKEGSVPRVELIINKGIQYERRKSVKQEESIQKEVAQCSFMPRTNSVKNIETTKDLKSVSSNEKK